MPSSFRTAPIQVLPTPQHVKETLADAISICRSCSKLFRSLHSRAITCGLQSNLFLSSILITKYFAFGDSCAAQLLFDSLPVRRRKPLLWNSLISGYLRCQLPRLALDTFRRMVSPSSLDCDPDKRTFHLALTACARLSEFKFGLTIGDRARSLGFQSDLLVATALVVMYARSGELESARQVFDQMPVRDPVCWNAMVSGYSQAGLLSEAVELFRIMRIGEGIGATEGSLVSLLSSFGNDEGWVRNGEILHAVVVITGFEENVLVLNSLLEMYVEFGCLEAAVRLFDSMVLKDSISWSTMIGGYVKNGKPSEALKTFYWMLCKTSILPVRPILVNAFLACASLGDWEAGEWIQKKFLLSNDDDLAFDGSLATALIYMYARCKKPGIALQFLETDERVKGDVIAWNAVIKACAEVGDFRLVFELALKMQRRGVNLDKASYLMLLSVISTYALSRERGATHTLIVKTGFGSERSIANSLIDVYAQFGSLEDVDNVFKDIKVKDVISWSLIIRAYALNGNADGAFEHFSLMRSEKVSPNKFTFLALLSACSHVGYVDKGRELFASMVRYGLNAGIEHFTCLFDMFCRAGLLDDLYYLLKDLKFEADISTILWGTLLSACRMHGNLVVGEVAARHLFLLEPENAANYLMLADIYILSGKMENSNAVLRLLRDKGLVKRSGFSWFDVF